MKAVSGMLHWDNPYKAAKYPFGTRFARPARFEDHQEAWHRGDMWSLVVESNTPINSDGTQTVSMHFLFDDAPQEWLQPNAKFELYDGYVCIAKGCVA